MPKDEDYPEELRSLLKYAFDESKETMVDQGRILTPKSDEAIFRESEVMVLRNISDTLAAINSELADNRKMMGKMVTDVAVLMDRERGHIEMKEVLEDFRRRIENIETRNAQQDGALNFATVLKDFGPWIISIAALIWAYVRKS